MENNKQKAKPFVKWVGGKSQLLNDIRQSLPSDLKLRNSVTYIEPFVGGGAVLFWLLQEYPNIKKAVINDINQELICTYRTIKEKSELLIDRLGHIQTEYLALDHEERKEYFLRMRTIYNTKQLSGVDTAALFIFLNRTCFNGLYRVNSSGNFNVPHGKYANPKICDEETIRADAQLLSNVEILCGDYSETLEYANPDSLFYFDPPYRPLSDTSAFTSYSANGFNDLEQERLSNFCGEIAQRGATFIASNSDPHNIDDEDMFFDKLYNNFKIKRVSASRMINANSEGRGAISELLISNI